MGKITEALKKVRDERISRIQKKPETEYIIRKIENTKIEEHIVSFHDPSSPIGEQYKILRTNLLAINESKGYKTFAITSSINGEGKTVTALNLSIAMAHSLNGKNILLIDADMRKGRVAKYLGIKHHPGLSDILEGRFEADSAFVSPGIDNLTILPSGKTPKNPSELLNSKKMENLLTSLKTKFEYIFIDTPPVMPLTDACIIGPYTDGVILIVQAGRTQRDIVAHTESRLNQARAKVIGYVMTNVEYHLPQYLYRYIHKYSDYAYYNEPAEKSNE